MGTAIVIYLLVLVLGSIPGAREQIGELSPGVVLHAVTYGFLALCIFGGVQGTARRRAVVAWLAIVAMGAFDEYLQSFFPYRTATVLDWVIDVSAALLVCVLLRIIWPGERMAGTQSQ